MKPKSISINPDSLAFSQKNRCWLCGAFMSKKSDNSCMAATRDHLIPRSKLKKETVHNNKSFAHRECNVKRGNRDLTSSQFTRARYYQIVAIAFQLSI